MSVSRGGTHRQQNIYSLGGKGMAQDLQQTKGQFKLRGKIKGIDNENALRTGDTQKGDSYKALSFFVETSPNNAVKVELFGMEREFVYFYSSKHKDTKKVKWADRDKAIKEYKLIGTKMGIELDEDDKVKNEMMVEWDAIDYMAKHLKEGMSVYVSGDLNFSTYENDQGETKNQVQNSIRNITLTKEPIDFEADDFKEMASFEQDIVVVDTIVDKESGKLNVMSKYINYKGDSVDNAFVVDINAEDGKYKKLANNMKKRFKFGDAIKVYGLILNMAVKKEVEADVEEDDWGGEKPAGMDVTTEYVNEMRITAVDSSTYEPKKYTEEDFYSEDEANFDGDDFADDEEFEDEFSDEELPFD